MTIRPIAILAVWAGAAACSHSTGAGIATPAAQAAQAASFWVYRNGSFNWAGDYSWNARVDYTDKGGGPVGGSYDIAVTVVDQWGGFQPYAPGKRFDTSPYRYLTYSLKPTKPGQVFATIFNAINDVVDGVAVTTAQADVTKYGPVPQPGVWATYRIPLADFKLDNRFIQKFTIADGTGRPANVFYVDNVGFTN